MDKPDTNDLDALLASLNGSAERFQTLWFSFLGLSLYLAIAALATTHRNLLLDEAQVLPILNIKVGLLPFYAIAPLLYFVFHFYVLMMLVLLARTAAPFEQQLRVTLSVEADRERYRAKVENALFLQMLIGMRSERAGLNAWLLGLIALITIVLAPRATLILMQMKFLPYHSLAITWWHRGLVAIDLALIIVMWGLFFRYSGSQSALLPFRSRPRLRVAARGAASLALITLAFWLSGWAGRWAGEPGIGRSDLATTAEGVVFGHFPDRLILRNETIVGEKLLDENKKEAASRGGGLVPTILVPTIKLDDRDLTAADLSSADLRGVSLQRTKLQSAQLSSVLLDRSSLLSAQFLSAATIRSVRPENFKQGSTWERPELERLAEMNSIWRSMLPYLEGPSDDVAGPITPADVDRWEVSATAFASEKLRPGVAARFDRLRPEFQTAEADASDLSKWNELEKQSHTLDPDGAQHRRRLATILGDLSCDEDGAPYVARALVRGFIAKPTAAALRARVEAALRLAAVGDQLDRVRNRMKAARNNPETCPGIAGFTEDDWRRLDAIKPAQP